MNWSPVKALRGCVPSATSPDRWDGATSLAEQGLLTGTGLAPASGQQPQPTASKISSVLVLMPDTHRLTPRRVTVFSSLMLETLDLNGTWRLRWTDGERGRVEYANRPETDEARYLDARVPGEVHLDLWRAGLIDDPYVGTNCLKARWVEECVWAYRR